MPQTSERLPLTEIHLEALLRLVPKGRAEALRELLDEDKGIIGFVVFQSSGLDSFEVRVIHPRSEYAGHLRSFEQAASFRLRGVEPDVPDNPALWWKPKYVWRRKQQ